MRAICYEEKGAARKVLQMIDLPLPEPAEGEVRVRLVTSGVNPSDAKNRSGSAGFSTMLFPRIVPHSDGAGVIDAVGTGVPSSRIGERVWIWNGQSRRPCGTAAEAIALPSRQAVYLPETTSFEEGACLGIPAMTAFHAVRSSGAQRGQILLVAGGAGAVAHYAIQMAKLNGIEVITTVSSDEKRRHAQNAGADHIINYRTEDVAKRIRELTEGRGVNAIIEMNLSTNATLIQDILQPHGSVVCYGTSEESTRLNGRWMLRNSISLKFFLVYELLPEDRQAAIDGITDLLVRGALRHAVSRTLPLSDTAEAHELLERGEVIGNIVLSVPTAEPHSRSYAAEFAT